MVLDTEYAQSIYGTTICKSTRSHHSDGSEQQSITTKRVEYAAQYAAKKAEMEMDEAITAQNHGLDPFDHKSFGHLSE